MDKVWLENLVAIINLITLTIIIVGFLFDFKNYFSISLIIYSIGLILTVYKTIKYE